MENDLVEKIRHWFSWGDASEILEFLKKNRIFEFCEEIKAELDENIKNLDNQIDNLETENEELKEENEDLKEKVEKLKKCSINKLRRIAIKQIMRSKMKNDLIERLQYLSILQIESLKKNKHALQPFTVEETIESIIQERNRLILAYNQNPLDEKINAEILKEIELLQAGLRSTLEPEILDLRKAIELEIGSKCNAEIGAKILKIESMNVEQLKELLVEIKSQPYNQTIASLKKCESDDVEVFDSSKEFWQKQDEEINRLIELNKDFFVRLKNN